MRLLRTGVAAAVVVASVGCRAEVRPATKASISPRADGGIALVVTDAGLAGIAPGTSAPRWVAPGAVAAPGGSAIFTVQIGEIASRAVEVAAIDPWTGGARVVGLVPRLDGIHVATVEPGGERVVLAAPAADGGSTMIVDFDAVAGHVRSTRPFEGRVEPEAFSLDGLRLFAARIYDDYYHVHVLDLATGSQIPTSGPDKTKAPEEMYGSVVQAALSPSRRELATLYRDTSTPEHSAFVHLLALDSGLTICIDLHEPFGVGAPGADAIAWTDNGRIVVGHRGGTDSDSMIATFDPSVIWSGEPREHYHAATRSHASPPGIPGGIAGTPGFQRFVAVLE